MPLKGRKCEETAFEGYDASVRQPGPLLIVAFLHETRNRLTDCEEEEVVER